jgi:hypothetical protein
VVVSNDSPAYVDADGPAPMTTAEWRAGFRPMLGELTRRGTAVIVIGPVPDYGLDFPREGASVVRPDIVVPVLRRSEVERRRRAVVDAERAEIDGRRRVAVVDPDEVLCGADTCRPVVGGRWFYSEPALLNRVGGEALAPQLDVAFADVLDRPAR